MAHHDQGPRRSRSVNSYLVETRALAAAALLALVAGVVLDQVTRSFWARNALLAGLVSSLIVVMLSVALVNEVVERRKRRRWSVLAQYVMLELVRQARLVWTGVMELTGLMPADATDAASIDAAAAEAVHDTQRLKDAVRDAVGDEARRRRLHGAIGAFVTHGDELLGRRLTDRIVTITQLAENLDRTTLELAMRIVPVEWWAARLGTTVPAPSDDVETRTLDRPVA